MILLCQTGITLLTADWFNISLRYLIWNLPQNRLAMERKLLWQGKPIKLSHFHVGQNILPNFILLQTCMTQKEIF